MDTEETPSTSAINPTSEAESDRPPWSRRRYWLCLLGGSLLILLLIILAVGLSLVDRVNRRLASAIANANRDDPNWRMKDLLTHHTPVSNEENSARIVAEVVSLFPENWPYAPIGPAGSPQPAPTAIEAVYDRIAETAGNVRLDDETLETLRDELANHEEAIRIARTVANYDRGRHELILGPKVFDTLLPETQAARAVARLLATDAAILAHDGDLDEALDSCRAMIGVGRSIGDEPFLISQLVRAAIDSQTMDTARRVLGQGEPSDAALARFQALVLKELAHPFIVHGLKGERATLDELIRRIEAGEISMSESGDVEQENTSRSFLRTKLAKSWQTSFYRPQRAIAIEWMNELVAIARRPSWIRPRLWKAWEAKLVRIHQSRFEKFFAIIPLLMSPAAAQADSALTHCQGKLGAMAILIAAERHRRMSGDWPATITTIDPSILAHPPLDPFVGAPFRILHREGRLLIHSIGPNLTDEQGAYDPKRWGKGGPDDVGAVAWDVSQRAQAPLP